MKSYRIICHRIFSAPDRVSPDTGGERDGGGEGREGRSTPIDTSGKIVKINYLTYKFNSCLRVSHEIHELK